MGWENAIGSIAASAIGGGMSYLGASSANEANQQAAQHQMAFQERMDSTKYQRAVADLKAAGLNPMMAYGNMQTNAPSGALGVGAQNTFAQSGQQIGEAVGKGAETAMKMATIKNLEAQNQQIHANTAESEARTELARNQSIAIDADILSKAAQAALATAQVKNTSAMTARTGAETSSILQDIERMQRDVPRQIAEKQKSESWWGRNVSPFLKDIPFVNSGAAAIGRFK